MRGAAAQLAAAQAAALAGVKRSRGDAEIDTAEPNVEVAPGAFKRRVLNPHGPAVDGSAAAENISQVCVSVCPKISQAPVCGF